MKDDESEWINLNDNLNPEFLYNIKINNLNQLILII